MKGQVAKLIVVLKTDKLVQIALLLATLWCLTDFINSMVSGSSKGVSLEKFADPNVVYQSFSEAEHNSLVERYSLFTPTENEQQETTKAQQGMSLEEQQKQQGLMQSAFISDYKIALKAVVSNTVTAEKQVLLQVENIKTGEINIERFSETEQVYGFDLKVLKATQISLSKTNADNSQQKIILTMYVVPASNKNS